jgi:hypothetical protein
MVMQLVGLQHEAGWQSASVEQAHTPQSAGQSLQLSGALQTPSPHALVPQARGEASISASRSPTCPGSPES